MKELHGTASVSVTASAQECFELLIAVEDYPRWYPDTVNEVRVTERSSEDHPVRARAKLHIAYGPLVRDFDLSLAIGAQQPHEVTLTRVPHDADDPERFEVAWTIGHGTITVALEASLSVPRLLPVGGIADEMANGFAHAAARALSRSR